MASSSKLKKVLFIPDTHVPYHDERAFDLMLEAASAWKPDTINILGDFMDCWSISSHSKAADRSFNLQEEVTAANLCLDFVDQLGAREKHYVSGNHEDRLIRYINDKAPELFGLVDLPKLLNLKKRGWTWTPYKESRLQGKLHVTHDCGSSGPNAHVQARATFESNVIMGHTHRLAVSYGGNAQGKSKVGMMCGWLGDANAADYMFKIKALRDWSLGFGIGYQEASGVVHLQPVPIVDYKVVLEGKLYVG